MKAFAGWFFKYIITPLIATFVIGFILSSLKIAPLYYLAYPIYVVGGSFFALIVITAIGFWGWHRERLKNFRKIFPVYKPVSKLEPQDFGISKYHYYYANRESDAKIEKSVNEIGLAFITGVPNIGKTRGAYQAARAFKGWHVLIPKYEGLEITELKFPLFRKKIVLFLDDLEKFIGKFNLDRLIDALRKNSKELKVIATCRNGKEFEQVVGQKEMAGLLATCQKNKFEYRRLEEEEQKELARQLDKKWEEVDSDGTPGSIALDLGKTRQRYNELPAEQRTILHVLKLLREASIYSCTRELIMNVAESQIFELKAEKYKWDEWLNDLHGQGFLNEYRSDLDIAHDSYLDDDFLYDYKVSLDTLSQLKNVLYQAQDSEGLFLLGVSFDLKENSEECTDCYQMSLRLSPDNAFAHYFLAGSLEKLDRNEEAKKEYEEAIRIDKEFSEAHNDFAILLEKLGRKDEAEKEHREAIRINPDDAETHNNMGILLMDLNRPEEAEEEFREAVRINPDYAAAHYSLGYFLVDLNRPEEAEKEFREAIRINPNYAEAHYNLAILLMDLNRPEEAEKEYREAIRINPNYADAHWNLGLLYIFLDMTIEAESELDIAVKIFKKERREEDLKKAEELFKKLESLDKEPGSDV